MSEVPTGSGGSCSCGAPADVGALCSACLLRGALGSSLAAGTKREVIGGHEILEGPIEGGMGVVYFARKVGAPPGIFRALKMMRTDHFASPRARAYFRQEFGILAKLKHSGIVRLIDAGEHEDQPYYTMEWMEGGTLADCAARFGAPHAAAQLIVRVARAVDFLHRRGILHLDLKPANILFDLDWNPHVADFGLARIAARVESGHGPAFQGGTVGWMSPEQALQGELTVESDVFSLGILLYWLLTGTQPFGDGEDSVRRVANDSHAPLRTLYRGPLWWELDQICERALHKQPEQRYGSAAELVHDLERARDGRPIQAERRRPMRRAAKWMRRHNLAALAAVELCMLLVYLPLMPISVLREVKTTVREQIRFSAGAQAGAVMNELRASVRRVEELALDPEVTRLVNHPDPYLLPPELAPRIAGFDGLSVFSAEGILRARFPAAAVRHPTLDFAFRDYSQGQLRSAVAQKRDVYVARAFHSTGDEEPMLALSTPLYDGERHVGFLVARTRARATFGAVQMNCAAQGSCMTALLGPRDRDRKEDSMPGSIYVLAAPGLADGQETMLEAPLATRICARLDCRPRSSDQFAQPRAEPLVLDDYEDPVSHTHSMAALAPVGGTGLIVVVAMPNNALDAITERMTDQIKAFLWVPVSLGLLLLSIVLVAPRLFGRIEGTVRPDLAGRGGEGTATAP